MFILRILYTIYIKLGLIIFIPAVLIAGCSGGDSSASNKENEPISGSEQKKLPKSTFFLRNPSMGQRIEGSGIVAVAMNIKDGMNLDSMRTYIDGVYLSTLFNNQDSFSINSKNLATGEHTIKVIAYADQGASVTKLVDFILLSDIEPDLLGYRVVNQYPHDPEAYTQGLFYDEGYIYESTGQNGSSSLRKSIVETGELVKSAMLEQRYFGEGITLFDNRIIQLTWTSKVGFVYDKESFQVLNRIHYSTQGWGLTTMEDQLIMSDGSFTIYFLDPEYFTEINRLEVYDNKGPVAYLNELEYIEPFLYANIYQTDRIARIDPETGKVHAYIDLRGILPQALQHDRIDVLNGIAYDSNSGRLFITGKMWPRIFEIEWVEK